MTESRRPHAWAWLALAWLLVVGALAWQQAGFWREGRLDSDVLALLPGAHEDPRQAQANARLAEGGTRQVVVLLGHADWATLRRGAEAFSASLREGGHTVASGAASFGHGWLGVHGMRTAAARRGQGLAGRVLSAMAAEAARRGLTGVFLQVDASNQPALALYRRAGLTVAWRYAYWHPASD